MIIPSNLDEMIPIVCNTEDYEVHGNIRSAVTRDLPWLQLADAHDGVAVIVGGGPSMKPLLPMIAGHKAAGHKIFAVNGTTPTLAAGNVTPDYFVLLDARAHNQGFIHPDKATKYLIASQCSTGIFEALEGHDIILWHPAYPEIQDFIGDRECALIGGGTTVGLQAMSIAFCMGYRSIHLYGFDSSYSMAGEGHAYAQDANSDDDRQDCWIGGKKYVAAPWMARQAMEFQTAAQQLADADTVIQVHGTGLLPAIAKQMSLTVLTAVYDLACSPPTFDFCGFLAEAERARIAGEYDKIDVIFQPGPDGGFRADNLPPRIAMRESMLWRVCVAMARLLPSVRDVTVLKIRRPVEGAVFPEGWTEATQISHYGCQYLTNLQPILRASEIAKEYVAQTHPRPFVSITLRSAKHWPNRNSDFDIWYLVAKYLDNKGFDVVWLPDEDGKAPSGVGVVSKEAFFDVDIRAAIYEKSELVLSVANGPMGIAALLNCKYLTFMKSDADCYSTSVEFYRRAGWGENHQMSANGRLIWGDGDKYDLIISEIQKELFQAETRKTA